jgi:hypothetical protein
MRLFLIAYSRQASGSFLVRNLPSMQGVWTTYAPGGGGMVLP